MIPDDELRLLHQYGLDDPVEETVGQLGMDSVFDAQPDEDAVIELWNERLDNDLCPACGRVTIQLTSDTDPILKRLRLPDGVRSYLRSRALRRCQPEEWFHCLHKTGQPRTDAALPDRTRTKGRSCRRMTSFSQTRSLNFLSGTNGYARTSRN